MSSGTSRDVRGYAENSVEVSAGWEGCRELNELEVAERVKVAQIGEIFEVSRHVPELATAHNVPRIKKHGILPKPHKKPYIKRHVMQHSLLACLDPRSLGNLERLELLKQLKRPGGGRGA